MRAQLVFASSVVFLLAIFVFLSPELKNVSRETFAAETTTNSEVSEGLTCQCGCGLTVANCNMPTCGFSVPMRHDIDRMIGEGKTRAQIIAFYRRQYGEKVLSAPTTEGFNILAWTMPFIALALGGGMMVLGTVIVMWPNVRERAAIATALSRSTTDAGELADAAPGGD